MFLQVMSPVSPPRRFPQELIRNPQGIAVDKSGNVWVINGISYSVTELKGVAAPLPFSVPLGQ